MSFLLRIRVVAAALLLATPGLLRAQSLVVTWKGGAGNSWFNPANWTPSVVPGAGYTVNITNGTPSLTNAAATIGTLNLGGGTLNAGTGGLTISSGGTWSGGTLGGTVVVGANAGFTLDNTNAGGTLDMPGTTFVVDGGVYWYGGTIRGNGSTMVDVSGGGWFDYATNGIINNAYGGNPVFNLAAGSFEVDLNTNGGTSTGTATFTGVGLNSDTSSEVDVLSGTLQLGGGGKMQGIYDIVSGAGILLTGGAFTATNLDFYYTGSGTNSLTGGSLLLATNTLPGMSLKGGTVTPGPNFQNNGVITNLTLSGSTLAGSNTLTGTLNWQAGGISNIFNIASTGVLTLSGSGAVTQYAAITNAGQIIWNGAGNWSLWDDGGANAGMIDNLPSGLISIQCNNTIVQASGANIGWILNSGSIVKSMSTNTTTVSVIFTNTGTVTVDSGTLLFNNAIADYFGGNFEVANGTFLNLNDGGVLAGSFNAGYGSVIDLSSGSFTETATLSFGGTGTTEMTSGSLTLQTGSVPNLQLKGGTLALGPGFQGGSITNLTISGEVISGSNYVTGVVNFLQGTLTGPMVLAPGAVLNWSGGYIDAGIFISPGATLNLMGLNAMYVENMTNSGTVNWTGGSLVLINGSTSYNLAGGAFNIECDNEIQFYNGAESFNNAGTMQKSVTTGQTGVYVNFINSGNVVVQTGTLFFDYYYNGLYGASTVLGGDFLAETGAALDFYGGGSLTGSFTSEAGASINIESGAYTPSPSLIFNGPGTNTISGGTITLTNNTETNLIFTGGTVSLTPGFQGGSITNLSLHASIAGTNTVTGVLNLYGNVSGPLTVVSNAVLNLNGNIQANLTLLPGSVLNWTNGQLEVPASIPSNAVINVVSASGYAVGLGSSLTNAGTINWISGEFYINYYDVLDNLAGATFNMESTSSGYDGGTLANAGLVQAMLNNGNCILYWNVNNTGEVDVQTGDLIIDGAVQNSNMGGIYRAEAGAVLTLDAGGYLTGEFTAMGGGTINFSAGVFTNTTTTLFDGLGNYNLNGGTFNLLYDLPSNLNLVNGSVNPGPLFQGGSITSLNLTNSNISITGSNYVSGVLNLQGNVLGPLTIAPGATFNWGGNIPVLNGPLNIAAGGVVNLSPANLVEIQATVTNSGTINWRSGYFQLYYNHGIYNLAGGVFNILTDLNINIYDGQEFFLNNGLIRKTGTTGSSTIYAIFTNNGTIDADSGTMVFNNQTYQIFAQSGGVWDIGINGPTNNGVIAFEYAAPLPSAFNVILNTNYILGAGNSFNLVDYTSASGLISTTNLPGDGGTWQLNQGPTNLALTIANLAAPTVSLTSPANNAYLVAPSSITISATATPAGAPISYVQFYAQPNLLAQVSSPPYTFTWTNVAPGNYALRAWAVDTNGAIGISAPSLITVVSNGPQPTNYTWVGNGTSTDWFTASNWSPPVVPGPLDTAIIAGGTVTLSQPASVNNVVMSAGIIGGAGALTVTNLFYWTGGTVTNTLNIPTNGILFIDGGTIGLSGGTIVNQGTVQWLQGSISGNGATRIVNDGLWLAEASYQFTLPGAVSNGLFINNGVFRSTASPVLFSMIFTNIGTVDAESGNLAFDAVGFLSGAYNAASNANIQFNGGAFTINTQPVITGQGNVAFDSGTLTLVSNVPSALQLKGGTVNLGPGFQGGSITNLTLAGSTLSGSNIVTGTLTCTNSSLIGGSSGGRLEVAPSGTLILGSTNVGAYTDVGFYNLSLLNLGKVVCLGADLYDYYTSAYASAVTNDNLWLFSGGSSYTDYLEEFKFVNNGTVRSDAPVTVYIDNASFLNNGLIAAEAGTIELESGGTFAGAYNAAAGAYIVFDGGTNVVNAPPNFTGEGFFQLQYGTLILNNDVVPGLQLDGGTVTLGPAFQNGGAINNLTLSGATLGGTNIVTGSLTLAGPSGINGPLTVNSGANLTFSNASIYATGPITNFGSVFCIGSSGNYFNFAGLLPAGVVNNSLWLDQGSSSYSGVAGATFVNNSVYRKEDAPSISRFYIPLLNSNGLADVLSSSLYLQSAGVLAGTYNTAAGCFLYVNGTYSAGLPLPVFEGLGISELGGSANLTLLADQIPGLQLDAGIVLVGPNFQRAGAITNLSLNGATLGGTNVVSGTLALSGQGNSAINGALTVLTNGLVTISGASSIYFPTGSSLVNQGVVDWAGGEILVYPSVAITNSGVWLIETDNTFANAEEYLSNSVFANPGNFIKTTTSGTTIFYGISFFNSGNLDLESGALNLSANEDDQYFQTGATLTFGVSAPNLSGKLMLGTNINLDGTLALNLLNGYTPQLGDNIPLISFTSGSGSFANLALPDVAGGNSWDVDYGTAGINLRVVPGIASASPYTISGLVLPESGSPIPGLVVYATQVGASNLIQNGSFEAPQIPQGYTYYPVGSTNLTGWTVTGPANANIAIHNNYLGPAEDGAQYFDPTGNTGSAGISQTFATVTGTTYELVFYHGSYNRYGNNAVLGVTIGTNNFTYNETDGGGNLDWRRVEILFTASSSTTTLTFQDLNHADANNNFVDNVQVIPAGFGSALQAVPNANGNYSISVPNGTYQVGLDGLPAAGYNNVANVTAVVNNGSAFANFSPTPATGGQFFTITPSVNSAALGTVSGGGTNFPEGALVTVTATQIPNALPYHFYGWTENGVLESIKPVYSFPAVRNRILVANFVLPGLLVTASNNPAFGGEVSGTGVFTYNSTNVLTAFPYPGYKFLNWSEGSSIISSANPLTTTIVTNLIITANFGDANPFHVLTASTLPITGLGVVSGTGTYTNGQTATVSAPVTVTSGNALYIFNEFMLNGSVVATSPSFNRTFTTFDPTNLPYLAVYSSNSILPQVVLVSDNIANPVPATANFLLAFQFDRSMNTKVAPLVRLTNAAPGAVQASVSPNGIWTTTVFQNDTYQTPGITFGNGMDGQVQVFISHAQDIYGHTLPLTDATNITVQSTPPPPPLVKILSPVNGAVFSSAGSFIVNVSASSATNSIRQVQLYAGASLLNVVTVSPYNFNINGLPGGSYQLRAVAVDGAGLMATSAVVHITVNSPGSTLIDFEALDASMGPVGGLTLSNYLSGFGVGSSNVVPATAGLAVVNDQQFLGGGAVQASSGDDFLAETGANGAVSYTLYFTNAYASVGWVRPRLLAGTVGVSLPGWRAHALDNTGKDLGSVGETALVSYADVPAAPFTLLGPNIWAIRFDGNNQGVGSLATLPLDDLLLSTKATNTSLLVSLTSGVQSVLTAPGTAVLQATVSDTAGTVSSVQFYEGANLVGTASVSGGTAVLSLSNLASGSYVFTAVAMDNLGASRSSTPLNLTVASGLNVSVINFDAPLNTANGSVGGSALSNYLYGFGVVLSNATVGTAMEAVNPGVATGSGGSVASSPPNYFTQEGLSTPVSFTLGFMHSLQSFGFTRVGLVAGSGGVSHPQWKATIFGADGTVLGLVGEGLIQSATNVPARSFVLSAPAGTAIASVRFDSDSQKTAAFSAVLLDDLILDAAASNPELSVTVLSPANGESGFVAPANITLSATANDTLGNNYYISFYAGPNLIGSVSNAPYNVAWTNVLAGNYVLRAEAVDVSGLAAYSGAVNITVGSGGNAQVANFDILTAPATGTALNNYLSPFGMSLSGVTAGSQVTVESQSLLGGLVAASSPSNVLTQVGVSGPVSYTVNFGTLLTNFGFTRPELVALPFVSHPAWQATAYDGAGVALASVGEGEIGSYTNVGASAFSLSGPGIASVQFASEGTGLESFKGMVADDFVLTPGTAPFPPAVAITNPASGLQLVGSVLPVGATAVDATGVTGVGFYANGVFIGSSLTSPYGVLWTNQGAGGYVLTAVATNHGGLVRMSPPVTVSVLPAAYQFGILTPPSSQVAATGGTVVFTVVASGTNTVTYQWYQNQNLLTGQTGPGLTLSPVGAGDVGTYTVQLSSGGETLSSAGAVLEVLDPPTFVVPPASQSVAAGVNILMTNQVDGDGPLSWQWLLNGTSIAGATNSTYAIQSAQPLNSGSYQVVAANAAAFSVSAPAQVTIQAGNGQVETADDFTNRISINPLLGAVMGNNQSATSEPHEPMHDGKPGGKSIWYTWHASFTGVISLTTLGSDFDTLLAVYTGTNVAELTPVAADDDSGGFFTSLVTFNVTAGTDYQIAVDGFKGASGNVVLGMPAGTGYRVLAPGSGSSVPVISVQPTNQLVTVGSKVTLTVTAANAQTYQWYFQGLPVSGANGASLVINNFQAGAVGLYDVLVANTAGSVESEQASVQVAVVNQTGGDTSAQDKFGDAVDLAAKIGAKSSEPVTPSAGGGDTRGFSISQTFSTVGATKEPGEPNTCGQAGGASQWYIYTAPAAGTLHVSTAGSTFNTILGVYTGPGTSFATLTNVGCDYTTNYQTKGQPSVVIAGVAANTRFYITVDGYQGASGRAQLQVGLGAGAPTFVGLPTNQFVVAGSKASFNVTAQGTTPLSYQWQLNGATVPKATNTTYTVANAQSGFAGSYTVVVSNVVGVVTSTPPALLVIQYAPGITAQPASQTVVMGRKSTLTASAVGVNTPSNPIKYQWYFNGAPKTGATGPSLTFPAVNWTNGGSYYLVATNNFSPMYGGPSTSQVAVLTVKDTVPPVVAIVSPSTKTTSTQNAPLTVSGTASDAAGIQAVYVEVNNSGFQLAAGSTSWSLPVTLVPGSNVLTAQAVDLAGNTNTTLVRRNIFYAVSSMLTLVTNVNGVGKVTSTDGATNGATLVIGQNYIVNASVLPGMNWLFDKWSSGAANLGTSNSLKFAMSSNLVLQANFITNPFPALAGVYNGLFYPTSGVTESNSGYVSLTLTASLSGAYSAQVLLNGSSNRFTGTFNAQGQSRHALAGGVVVWLAMDLNPADDLLGGTVSNAAWSSPIVADRAGTAAVANYAGQYTLLLPPGAGAPMSEPDGFGYAAISNSAGGVSTLTGVLADGSAFTRATTVAKDGSVPFYLSLYSGKGSLLGWIIFTNPPAQSFPAVLGSVSWVEWIKPALAKTFYANGFNELITNLPASYYTNATLGGGAELDLPNATLTLSNGNLSTPLVYNLVLDNGVLTNQNSAPTNYLAISNSPAYGTLTITFRPTGSKTNVTGHAAILQNQTNAQGSFTGSSQSGSINLQ